MRCELVLLSCYKNPSQKFYSLTVADTLTEQGDKKKLKRLG